MHLGQPILTGVAGRGASYADTPLLTPPRSSSLGEDDVDEGGDVGYVHYSVGIDIAALDRI